MPLPENTDTLFIAGEGWIQRLHPFTKLSHLLFTVAIVYLGPSSWIYNGILLVTNIVVVASGGLLKATNRTLGRIMLPLLLFMIPIHGCLYPENQTVLIEMNGIAIYQEGLLFALNTVTKLTLVLLASLLFVFSTHPADLITAISHASKSQSLTYLLGSPLLLLATMRKRINTIQAAQRARGLNTDGNIFQRFRCLCPLIIPLVVGAIVEAEHRSIALEVRGFQSTSAKTSLRTLVDSTLQRQVRWLMLAAATAVIFFHWAL